MTEIKEMKLKSFESTSKGSEFSGALLADSLQKLLSGKHLTNRRNATSTPFPLQRDLEDGKRGYLAVVTPLNDKHLDEAMSKITKNNSRIIEETGRRQKIKACMS